MSKNLSANAGMPLQGGDVRPAVDASGMKRQQKRHAQIYTALSEMSQMPFPEQCSDSESKPQEPVQTQYTMISGCQSHKTL
jgi:hypothetical protein